MAKDNLKNKGDVLLPKKASRAAEIKQNEKKEEAKNKFLDKVKLLLALGILALGVYGFYGLSAYPIYVRVASTVLGVVLALVIIFFWCAFGRDLIRFVMDATSELRKVVWLDRQTTFKTTMVVIAFVAVLAFFIYLADYFISWVLFDLFLKRGS